MNVHSYGKYRMDHEKAPEMRDLKKRPLYLAEKPVLPEKIDLAKSVTRTRHESLGQNNKLADGQFASYNFFEREFKSKLMRKSNDF